MNIYVFIQVYFAYRNISAWLNHLQIIRTPLKTVSFGFFRGEDADVDGSCVIRPPQSWCQIDKPFVDVASVGTVCSTTVSEEGSSFINESSSWNLSEVGK